VGRAHDAVIVLGERDRDALAVHLAAREQEHAALVHRARLEDDLGATDVGDQGAERVFEDVLHPDRGGQVEDAVALGHESLDRGGIEDRAFEEAEAGIALEAAEVFHPARGEVIQGPDLVASLEQCLG
jgi:hypothetical protein